MTILRALTVMVSIVAISVGCSVVPDRLNHVHDKENKALAEEALAQFESFSDGRVGLEPTLLASLGARSALERTVADRQARVLERAAIGNLLGSVWNDMWARLRHELTGQWSLSELVGLQEGWDLWVRRLVSLDKASKEAERVEGKAKTDFEAAADPDSGNKEKEQQRLRRRKQRLEEELEEAKKVRSELEVARKAAAFVVTVGRRLELIEYYSLRYEFPLEPFHELKGMVAAGDAIEIAEAACDNHGIDVRSTTPSASEIKNALAGYAGKSDYHHLHVMDESDPKPPSADETALYEEEWDQLDSALKGLQTRVGAAWTPPQANSDWLLGQADDANRLATPEYLAWQASHLLIKAGATRMEKLAGATQVLGLLVKAHQAHAAATKLKLEAAEKTLAEFEEEDPENESEDDSGSGGSGAIQAPDEEAVTREFLFSLQEKILAALSTVDRAGLRSQAVGLQRALLEEIRASRAPASAAALVAMVGQSFDSASNERLDEYLSALAQRLAEVEEGPKPLLAAMREVELTLILSAGEAWVSGVGGMEAEAGKSYLHSVVSAYEAEYRVFPPDLPRDSTKALAKIQEAGSVAQEDNRKAARAFLLAVRIQQERKLYGGGGLAGRTKRGVDRLKDGLPPVQRASEQLERASELAKKAEDGLAKAGFELEDEVRSLRGLFDRLRASLSTAKIGTASESVTKEALREGVKAALTSTPGSTGEADAVLSRKFTKSDGSETTVAKHLESILDDVVEQGKATRLRLVKHLVELFRVNVDLHEENVRHYKAMLAVAQGELKRHRLMSERLKRIEYLFSNQAVLFIDERDYSPADPDAKHKKVERSEHALVTIRKLAHTAKQLQRPPDKKKQALVDNWEDLSLSRRRLGQALELVGQYLAVLSLNRRVADRNAIRLQAELDEHALHLDALVARTEESGMRLQFLDLIAFHSTGINEDDIRATLAVAQAVLLATLNFQV